jgi:hypothetical protein
VVKRGGKKPVFDEQFEFCINSNSKVFGRTLTLTLMDKCRMGSDAFVAHGSVDVNPLINYKRSREEFRCILTYEYQ